MMEELINFDLPLNSSSIIKVIGVGGGGSNAVNHMFKQGIKDVDFLVCNTDAQALLNSPVPLRIQLGESLTEGRGAGNKPDIGRQSAIESLVEIEKILMANTKMVFITAGMGGGTGTGAAPIIAKAAHDLGILTVAIVTIPFRFEGKQRITQAIEGIKEIQQHVDSLLIINNEKLREIYGDLKLSEAFTRADNVLTTAAKGIAEIITVHGYINVDFADVQTVMTNSGVAIMGSGSASGENRAIDALKQALISPLLNNSEIKGAKNILLNITSGMEEISMDEVGEITDFLSGEIDSETNIIWGTGNDPDLGDKVNVTIIATGFDTNIIPELYSKEKVVQKVTLREPSPKVKVEEELAFEVVDLRKDEPAVNKTVENNEPAPQKFTLFADSYPENVSYQAEQPVDVIDKRAKPAPQHEYYQRTNERGQTKLNFEEIDRLESEPAYKRRNMRIDQNQSANDTKISRYTLEEDGDMVIIRKNPYLNDNVD